jgi:sugar lactone lactonase YvrE
MASTALRSSIHKAVITATLLLAITSSRAQTPILPSTVVYDASGNLFFADINRNQVFELPLSGALTLIAGNGTQGFSGDNASATNAELNNPQGLAIGSDGTLYVADTGNQRIRAVRNGIITTIAGTGTQGFYGDNATATNATLNTPTALAIDAQNNLLLCDTGNQRIRRIANGIITTIAGNGTQGFSGDNAAAINAELDTPQGITITSDGRILIADTHNQRIRQIDANGILTTIAGTGVAGSSGDNGPAIAAQLSQPRGLTTDAAGDVLIADTGNQRLRSINPQGILTTIAGSGTQGFSADGILATVAALNAPRSLAISNSGSIAFTDTSNSLIREIVSSGEIFTLVPVSGTHASSIQLSAPASTTYGQGSANITVQSNAAQPQGAVTLLDGAIPITTATLTNGSASLPLTTLAAGPHSLTATYSGDALNPAAASAVSPVNVSPATVTITANTVTISYGLPIPALTGAITGILPRDTSLATVAFTSSATSHSPVGNYPIIAAIIGPASHDYALAPTPASGLLQIQQAQSIVTMQPVAAQSYSGLPILLTASVASKTSGTPTGEVDFDDGATTIAKAICVNGIASTAYASPSAGTHTLAAIYLGDTNFLGSSSSSVQTSVVAMPDFTITSSSSSQSVQGGLIATYPLTISPSGGAFTGSVTFSVGGLPSGTTATFSPATVVPGAGSVAVTMSVQTVALAQLGAPSRTKNFILWVFCLPFGIGALRRRKQRSTAVLFLAFTFALAAVAGCGARTVADATASPHSSQLTVTATSTNLAGAAITHSTVVTLQVQ